MNIWFILIVLMCSVSGTAPSTESVCGFECACRSSSLIEGFLLFPLSLLEGDCYKDATQHHDDHGTNLLEFVLETGGTLAHALFPCKAPICVDTHFDDDEEWTERNQTGTDLEIVATLEPGHAIVPGHSNVKGALMQPFHGGYDPKYKLYYDDIRGAQSLYGGRSEPHHTALRPAPKPIPSPKMMWRPSHTQQPDDYDVYSVKFDDNGPDGRLDAFRYRQIYQYTSSGIGIARKCRRNVTKVFPKEPNNIGAAVYDRFKRKFDICTGLCLVNHTLWTVIVYLICFCMILTVLVTIRANVTSTLHRLTRKRAPKSALSKVELTKNTNSVIKRSALNKVEVTKNTNSVIQTSALNKVETTEPPLIPRVQHTPTEHDIQLNTARNMGFHVNGGRLALPMRKDDTQLRESLYIKKEIEKRKERKKRKEETKDISKYSTVTRQCTFGERLRGHVLENVSSIIDVDKASWVNNNVSFHTGDGVFEVVGLFAINTAWRLAQQAWQQRRDDGIPSSISARQEQRTHDFIIMQ